MNKRTNKEEPKLNKKGSIKEKESVKEPDFLDEDDNAKYEDKRYLRKLRAHRRTIFLRVMAVLLIVVGLVVYFYISFTTKSYTDYEVVNTVERELVSTAKMLKFGNNFLTYSADGIHCTDSRGNDIWSCPYEMQNPMVEMCGDYVAVADYDGRTIYVFNSAGQTSTIQTSNPIRMIKISAKGVVVCVVDGGDVTPIYLYYEGQEIVSFRTTMAKSGYPVAIGISDNSKLVGVSYLYLNNGEMTTKVAFYNFGEVGQNETDNLVSGYDYSGEVVPIIEFLDDSTAFALANDRLMFYQGREKPSNTANILLHDKVRSVFFGDSYVGLVYNNTDGEAKYRMDVYSTAGKLENSIYFDLDYREIFFHNNRIVIYNSAGALIYTVQGNLKFEGDFDEPVALMIPTNSSNRFLLVTAEAIKSIVLK